MVSYDTSVSDQSKRVLVSSGRFDPGELAQWRLLRAEGAVRDALYDHQPDLLILDVEATENDLLSALKLPAFEALPIILVAGDADNDTDAAGALLELNVAAFLPANPPPGLLAAEVARLMTRDAVHDRGSAFDPRMPDMDAIRRDMERLSAALGELSSTRQAAPAQRPVDANRIRAHIKARRLREKFFPADLFADPAWDMLLDLAAARLEGRQVSVSSLCIAATVPTTTGLRWIKQMVDRGLFVRHSDPQDARRAFITLSPDAENRITACLEATFNLPGQ